MTTTWKPRKPLSGEQLREIGRELFKRNPIFSRYAHSNDWKWAAFDIVEKYHGSSTFMSQYDLDTIWASYLECRENEK